MQRTFLSSSEVKSRDGGGWMDGWIIKWVQSLFLVLCCVVVLSVAFVKVLTNYIKGKWLRLLLWDCGKLRDKDVTMVRLGL